MILQHVPALNAKRIILASASPRRRELLGNLGLKFEIMVSSFEETLPHSWFENAADYAVETARHKALDIAAICAAQQGKDGRPPVDLIISADTIVEHNGYILEKPDDVSHARRMLESLSGSSHHVHTGVALVLPRVPASAAAAAAAAAGGGGGAGGEQGGAVGKTAPASEAFFVRTFAETTNVNFQPLPEALVDAYIHTGEPFGKAGSYGIQGAAASFVSGVDGCYFNVVGFPLNRFSRELERLIEEGYLPLEGSVLMAAPAAATTTHGGGGSEGRQQQQVEEAAAAVAAAKQQQ